MPSLNKNSNRKYTNIILLVVSLCLSGEDAWSLNCDFVTPNDCAEESKDFCNDCCKDLSEGLAVVCNAMCLAQVAYGDNCEDCAPATVCPKPGGGFSGGRGDGGDDDEGCDPKHLANQAALGSGLVPKETVGAIQDAMGKEAGTSAIRSMLPPESRIVAEACESAISPCIHASAHGKESGGAAEEKGPCSSDVLGPEIKEACGGVGSCEQTCGNAARQCSAFDPCGGSIGKAACEFAKKLGVPKKGRGGGEVAEELSSFAKYGDKLIPLKNGAEPEPGEYEEMAGRVGGGVGFQSAGAGFQSAGVGFQSAGASFQSAGAGFQSADAGAFTGAGNFGTAGGGIAAMSPQWETNLMAPDEYARYHENKNALYTREGANLVRMGPGVSAEGKQVFGKYADKVVPRRKEGWMEAEEYEAAYKTTYANDSQVLTPKQYGHFLEGVTARFALSEPQSPRQLYRVNDEGLSLGVAEYARQFEEREPGPGEMAPEVYAKKFRSIRSREIRTSLTVPGPLRTASTILHFDSFRPDERGRLKARYAESLIKLSSPDLALALAAYKEAGRSENDISAVRTLGREHRVISAVELLTEGKVRAEVAQRQEKGVPAETAAPRAEDLRKFLDGAERHLAAIRGLKSEGERLVLARNMIRPLAPALRDKDSRLARKAMELMPRIADAVLGLPKEIESLSARPRNPGELKESLAKLVGARDAEEAVKSGEAKNLSLDEIHATVAAHCRDRALDGAVASCAKEAAQKIRDSKEIAGGLGEIGPSREAVADFLKAHPEGDAKDVAQVNMGNCIGKWKAKEEENYDPEGFKLAGEIPSAAAKAGKPSSAVGPSGALEAAGAAGAPEVPERDWPTLAFIGGALKTAANVAEEYKKALDSTQRDAKTCEAAQELLKAADRHSPDKVRELLKQGLGVLEKSCAEQGAGKREGGYKITGQVAARALLGLAYMGGTTTFSFNSWLVMVQKAQKESKNPMGFSEEFAKEQLVPLAEEVKLTTKQREMQIKGLKKVEFGGRRR